MATEKRLIDALPLMQNGWILLKTGIANRVLESKSLADVPTVDAVEVVRCKDCKRWQESVDGVTKWCTLLRSKETKADDFCSFGERKGDWNG